MADPDEYLPLIIQHWCQRRLNILRFASGIFVLQDIRPDGTPNHLYIYLQLRAILHQDVFHLGFQLLRCHPPDGGYNWTPPISDYMSTVPTLSILGEETINETDF